MKNKIKIIFKGNTKWHDESIRDILLSEIPGNPETPKNSYVTSSLNKKIAPVIVELEILNQLLQSAQSSAQREEFLR